MPPFSHKLQGTFHCIYFCIIWVLGVFIIVKTYFRPGSIGGHSGLPRGFPHLLWETSFVPLSLHRQWPWEAGPAHQVPPSSLSVIGQEPSLEPIRAGHWQLWVCYWSSSKHWPHKPRRRTHIPCFRGKMMGGGALFCLLSIGRQGELDRRYLSYSSKEF